MLNYKGLKAVRERILVPDAQVDRQIDAILQSQMKNVPVTGRPAQAGDEVVLDYAGETAEGYFEGGSADGQALVLGSGTFIPGFEDQLMGHSVGEEVDVHVTFPEKYHAPQLAGKAAVFHCKLHEIRVKEKYKADDEFAREVGGCETFAEFRESMKEAMQAYADQQAENELKEQLLNQVCDSASFEISEEQINAALDLMMQSMENQLARQGLNLDMYCQFMNTNKEALREDNRNEARRNVERQLAIAEIAIAENIAPDEEGVAQALQQIARDNKMTIEQLQPHMDEAFQAAVAQSVITEKVLDFLVASSEIETIVKDV